MNFFFVSVKRVEEDLSSVHSRIGPVRIFLGALNEGTTEEEVLKVVEPLGEIKKIDVKVRHHPLAIVILHASTQAILQHRVLSSLSGQLRFHPF